MFTHSRLGILLLSLALLLAGGTLYGAVRWLGGSDSLAQSGVSALLLLGVVVWILDYLRRVLTGGMSLHTQRQVYEKERLKQALEAMTPEELAALQAEVDADPVAHSSDSRDSTV